MEQIKNKMFFMGFVVGTALAFTTNIAINFNSDVAAQKSSYEQNLTRSGNIVEEQKGQIEDLIDQNTFLIQENQQLKLEKARIEKLNTLSYEEWEYLYRVARAEAGANSKEGQKNVIYVVLNRINSDKFPSTIEEVIFQKEPARQFSCVWDGNFDNVEISEFTVENVQEAYLDYEENKSAEGALFFTRGKFAYEFLFTDEVGHNFYK